MISKMQQLPLLPDKNLISLPPEQQSKLIALLAELLVDALQQKVLDDEC